MSSIVLRIPYESASFHNALQALQEPLPTETYRERQTLLARVREWTDATLALDDAAYIPLRTDWIPIGRGVARRTDDGVEVLLAGRWPVEVQRAIDAGQAPRIGAPAMNLIWEMMCRNEAGQSADTARDIDEPAADGATQATPPVEAGPTAPHHMSADPEQCPEAAQVEGEEAGDDIASYGLSEASVPEVEPVIPDEEIDAAVPWSPENPEDTLTPIAKRLERLGAKFPPWFFDQPIEAVREGLKEKARDDRVLRTARLEQEAQAKREEETKYDRFFSVAKNGGIALDYGEIGAHLRETFHVLTFNKTVFLYSSETGLYVENMGQIENAVQEIAEAVGFSGRITTAKREAMSYVKDHNIAAEYPFNTYPGIPVANGVVRVDPVSGEIRLEPYSPEMRFTYRLPVVYDPAAPSDVIDTMLRQWVEPADVPLLYQIPAQAILHQLGRKKPYKKCYLLHGDPDAGKTTYIELLHCTFGAENCAGVALQRIGTDRFSKGALEGRILNTYDDLSDVPFDGAGAFKALTGGFEHDIERKGKDSYKGRIFAVHVFTCNKPPTVDDRNKTDSAFWGRWEYLTFPNSFPRDPSFHERMFTPTNISGFFNRVLETAITIAQKGELLVDSSAYVVRDLWSYNSDPLYRFIQENLEKNPKGAIPKDDLYDAYLKYCQFEQVDVAKIPASKDSFAKKLFGYDFGTSKQTVEGKRVQMFTGYAWQVSSRFKPSGTDQARIGGE